MGINPSELTAFNGKVLFNGENASGQFGLWVTESCAAVCAFHAGGSVGEDDLDAPDLGADPHADEVILRWPNAGTATQVASQPTTRTEPSTKARCKIQENNRNSCI
jgi:hypothetical protein